MPFETRGVFAKLLPVMARLGSRWTRMVSFQVLTGALMAAGAGGCAHGKDETQPLNDAFTNSNRKDRGGAGLLETSARIPGPAVDRCQKHKRSALRQPCDDAKYIAQNYTRRLSPGDFVCLENVYGEEPGRACLARAAVVNVQTGAVQLELREAKPESRWFQHVQQQIWFAEDALVDLYLAERGY